MKAVLALLLGLVSIAIADTDDTDDSGEAFSWDSADSDATTSYNGLVVQAYNPDDGNPVVTLGTDLDNHAATYCLTLIRVFEATGYDLSVSTSSDTAYEVIEGSPVDLSDANCTISETSDTTFTIACSDVNGASLTFAFTFVTNSDGDEGLEYTITLDDYTFTQDDAQFVLEQSVTDCSDLYEYSADSGSASEEEEEDDESDEETESTEEPETEETESTEEPDSTTSDPIRRLLSDTEESTDDTEESEDTEDTESDSTDISEEGISSDDSDEYDVGYAQFIVNGQAYDDCDGVQTPINSSLVYNSDDKVLHIVFDHFECNLILDPYIGVDESKLVTADSGAAGVYVMIAGFIGFIGALLF